MNASGFKYSVRLPLVTCPANLEWLGSKFLATLDALTELDSNIFSDWEVGDLPAMKGYPLAVARSRIAEIVSRNVRSDGYTAVAHTTTGARSRRMSFCARTWLGEAWLDAGDVMVSPDPAIVTFPLFRAALLAIHSIWPSSWACAQAFQSNTVKVPIENSPSGQGYSLEVGPMIPADPTFPESIFHIPWIAYLCAPLACGVKLPLEIQTERTPDGGLLLIATEERLDPDLPEHARRARILAETLIECTGNRS
ncbi:MAG TPA: hypothetical protein VGH13_02140 [Xanthobacteraceae bacterium]|jgi:hypothetical protein